MWTSCNSSDNVSMRNRTLFNRVSEAGIGAGKDTTTMTHRHHQNPLLKRVCPNIYSAFRRQDILILDSFAHMRYHKRLEKD